MAFLQINNPDGTSGIKRPFRLSDLQDIWNGIKSLFRALAGQQFRIISGFDLVGGVYTSGTVWYNGELYEYNSATYPITPNTTKVSFGSIAQDDRVWQGGDTRSFASRFICGGDDYSGTEEFTNEEFVAKIEKYKSYLGDGSVTTNKLANKSITAEKLAENQVLLYSDDSLPMATTAYILLDNLLENAPAVQGIEVTGSNELIIRINAESNYAYPFIPIWVRNYNQSSPLTVKLQLFRNGKAFMQATLERTLPANSHRIVVLAKGGLTRYGFTDNYNSSFL